MPEQRIFTIGGFRIERLPRGLRRRPRLPAVLALIGFALVAIHELAYRQTGGADFDIFETISHAGLDMTGVTIALAVAAALHGIQR